MTARCCQADILQALGRNTHDPAAGGIHCHQIAAHHQHSTFLGNTLNGAVALHADDAVDDGEA